MANMENVKHLLGIYKICTLFAPRRTQSVAFWGKQPKLDEIGEISGRVDKNLDDSSKFGRIFRTFGERKGFSESSVFAHLDRIVSFHFLTGRLSSNSCSAALICVFCATRRIRFFVSDLFQK